MTDWRLSGQEAYLKNAALTFSKYAPYREGWDHDHCEFCGRKFALQGGDFTEGYTTLDRYRWICEDCYNDFKELFEWEVDSGIAAASKDEDDDQLVPRSRST